MIVVSGLYSETYLNSYTYGFLVGKARLLFDVFLERNALYELHYDIVDAVLFTYIVNIYDILVHETCCSLSLNTEFGNEILVLGKLLLKNLNRYIADKLLVFSLIYIGHSARSDLFEDLISVPEDHSNLDHNANPYFSYLIRTTEILSRPPLAFAVSTSLIAASGISLAALITVRILLSSSILVSPSVHMST